MPHAAHGHVAQRGPRSAQQAYRPHGAGKARVKGRDDCKVSNSKGPFTFSRFFNIVHAVQPPSAPQGAPAFLERASVVRFPGFVHALYTHLLLIILAAAGPAQNPAILWAIRAVSGHCRLRQPRRGASAKAGLRRVRLDGNSTAPYCPRPPAPRPEPFPHWREDAHGAIPLARHLVERAGALFK